MATKAKTQPQSVVEQIALSNISISPFNYRYGGKPVDENSLTELTASIKTHEVLQAVTVRLIGDGKYELVIGERRFRASKLAGKKTIPAVVKELSDEQVKEIQLIENLQREDPHPMAEAIGFQQLLSMRTKKVTVEDLAARVGKSPAYVYLRLKLNSLTESFREMFFANVINTSQALRISRLDEGSQTEFFENFCKDWKEESWQLQNFSYRIHNFQLDLKHAPFNLKDAKLDKQAGACTKCPHNTAVTTSLFPEDSENARCTQRSCYQNKCRLALLVKLAAVLQENPEMPIAVPDETVLTKFFSGDDTLIKGRTVLTDGIDYSGYDYVRDKPVREEFTDYEEDEENEAEFKEAMEYYEDELKELEEQVASGRATKAIFIGEEDAGNIVYLNPVREQQNENGDLSNGNSNSSNSFSAATFRAKDYQEAVKSKTLSVEVIALERQRLEAREERSKELDEIKLQESFYAALETYEAALTVAHDAGANDRAVQLFVLYDSLGYSWKERFKEILFPGVEEREEEEQQLLQFFLQPTDKEVSVLTRMAMLNKSEAKSPNGFAGQMLRLMIEETPGMNAAELVNIQHTATKEREVKLSEKLAILDVQEKKIS